jgi:hypothetical protein
MYKNYKNIFLNFILIILPLIYFLYLNPLRNWIENYDEELWVSYNALLYLSNLPQEKFDAPHFLQFFLLSLFYKLLNFFDILNIRNIDDLNKGYLNLNLQKIVFFTRIYGLILGISFILLIKYFINKFFLKNDNYSFCLTFSLLLSGGYLLHIQQHRVEIITLISFIIAVIALINFIQNQEKKNLFFFTFFFILSIMTKVQIMFYAPLFFSLIFFLKKKIYYNDYKHFKFDYIKFIFLLVIMLIAVILRSEQLHSIIFLILYLTLINIIFYIFIFNKFTKKIIATYHLNLFFFLSFIIIALIVLLIPSADKELFYPFFRISKIRGYLVGELKGCCDLIVWLKFFLIYFFQNIKSVFNNLLLINFINFIFFEIIVLLAIFRKYLTRKIIVSSIIILLAFLSLKLIEGFRGMSDYYEVYYGWFLLLAMALVLNRLKKNSKNFIIFFTIISSFLITFKDGYFQYNYKSQNISFKNQLYYNRICAEKEFTPMSFWPYWLNKVKYENVKIYCNW